MPLRAGSAASVSVDLAAVSSGASARIHHLKLSFLVQDARVRERERALKPTNDLQLEQDRLRKWLAKITDS